MMDSAALKAKMKMTIYTGLKTQFGSAAGAGANYMPIADAHWEKMAEAISGVALDIVNEIVTNAIVSPGIPIMPLTGPTVTPGKIL